MAQHQFKFKAKVWVYTGIGGWHFVTLPKNLSKEIRLLYAGVKKGWGSIAVIGTIGKSSWKTSIFPDKKLDAYLLPLKAGVRKKEDIGDGDRITVFIDVVV